MDESPTTERFDLHCGRQSDSLTKRKDGLVYALAIYDALTEGGTPTWNRMSDNVVTEFL